MKSSAVSGIQGTGLNKCCGTVAAAAENEKASDLSGTGLKR